MARSQGFGATKCHYGEEKRPYPRGRDEDPRRRGQAIGPQPADSKRVGNDRQGQHGVDVVAEGRYHVAVHQLVDSSKRSTAGAVTACQPEERADGVQPRIPRVEQINRCRCGDAHDGQSRIDSSERGRGLAREHSQASHSAQALRTMPAVHPIIG